MDTKLPFGIRTRWFSWLFSCACALAGPFTSHAQSANISFSQTADSPLAVGRRATTPVIADVNGDGRADIVVALESDHAIAVLLGRPQGGFQSALGSPFRAGDSPFSIAVADLDGDFKLDVVAVNRLSNRLTLLRGDGLGGFTALGDSITTGKEPRTVRIADMNRDGKPDLAVANYGDNSVSILLGDGSGAFAPAVGSPIAVGRNPWGLTVGDYDGDGAPDLILANHGDNTVSVLLNDGTGEFATIGSPIAMGVRSESLTSADLNHDGRLDLVSANTYYGTVTCLIGDGKGRFTPPVEGTVNVTWGIDFPSMVMVADMNLDGHPDLVTANLIRSSSILMGNGSGIFGLPAGHVMYVPYGVNTLAVGDLNGDGAPDIVGCEPRSGLMIWLNGMVPPAIKVIAPPALESDQVARVTLRRSTNLTQTLSFLVSTRDDSSKAGLNYTAVQTRVEFAPNQTEAIVSIPLVNDDFWGPTRQFFLEFFQADPSVHLPWAVPVEVRDDDELVPVQIEVSGPGLDYDSGSGRPLLQEGAGPIRFTVRRKASVNSARPFQIRYQVEGRATLREESGRDATAAVAGRDFLVGAAEGVFEFGPGVMEQSVEVSIPNNTVAEGDRGIRFRVSYEDVRNQGMSELVAFIRDDERVLLRQQLVLEPYRPSILGNLQWSYIHGLSAGKALVIWEWDAVMRLTSDGLPDLSFGRGTGRGILPSLLPPDDFGETLRFDRELGDGGLQFWWRQNALFRLTADGVPDVSFGDGTGKLILSGLLQDTSPDGGLLLISEDGRHLNRLLPDGSVDPKFSTAWAAESGISWARLSPQGLIWANAGERLHLIQGTGELVTGFAPRPGVDLFNDLSPGCCVREPRIYFDQGGRAYLAAWDPVAFGDPTQGGIVRFLADGSYDADYRPMAQGTRAVLVDLSPDGTALAVVGDNELVKLDGVGRSHSLYYGRTIAGARHRSDGSILIAFKSCQGGGGIAGSCYTSGLGVLTPDGQLIDARLGSELELGISSMIFEWLADELSLEVRYHRSTTMNLDRAMVGLSHSGRYALESSASVAIQRAGSTATAATVRGRVFPLRSGKWDTEAAQSFEIEFAVGQADAELRLPQLYQPGRQTLREYLVRLENATGVELSDFTACRLWVLDDDALPSPGNLALERFCGNDELGSALLLGRWEPGKAYRQEFRSGQDVPWEAWDIFAPPGFSMLGPAWLRPVSTDKANSGYFRMWTP